MAAGEHLEADVAERVDEQRGGRLGVAGKKRTRALAVEQQLVAHDGMALVRDGLADDGDVGASGGRIGEDASSLPWSAVARNR